MARWQWVPAILILRSPTLTHTVIAGLDPAIHSSGARAEPIPASGVGTRHNEIGAWGSRDLTPGAPVELLFIHQDASGAEPSSCRLARRMVALCAARSANGHLCDVETGPLVTPLDAFVGHVRDSASAERLIAMTELRVIFGPAELRSRIDGAVRDLLTSGVAPDVLIAHARAGVGELEALGNAKATNDFSLCAQRPLWAWRPKLTRAASRRFRTVARGGHGRQG